MESATDIASRTDYWKTDTSLDITKGKMKSMLGLDSFEGRSCKGWHNHTSMVMLAFAFISLLNAEAQYSGGMLRSLSLVAKALILKVATWELMIKRRKLEKHRRVSTIAKYEAEFMLRTFSDW